MGELERHANTVRNKRSLDVGHGRMKTLVLKKDGLTYFLNPLHTRPRRRSNAALAGLASRRAESPQIYGG